MPGDRQADERGTLAMARRRNPSRPRVPGKAAAGPPSKRRQLRLDDPRWWRYDKVLEYCRAANSLFHPSDIPLALKQERLRGKVEYYDRSVAPPKLVQVLLTPELLPSLKTYDGKLGFGTFAYARECELYLWAPDVEKIWPDRVELVTAIAPRLDEAAGNNRKGKNIFEVDVFTATLMRDLKLHKGHGRHQDYSWDKIRREIVYQIVNNGSPKWPQNYSTLAENIAKGYQDPSGKGPDISDLRKMIAAIVKLLHALLG